MKLRMKELSAFLVCFASCAQSLSLKFDKIENCTASGVSSKLESCDIVGNNLIMVVDILRPLTKVFVTYQFNRRDAVLLTQLFKPIPIEWCSFMRTRKSSRITKLIFDSISHSIPQLFQPCPLKDRLDLNISFSDKLSLIQMMPMGSYQFYLKTHKDDENPIFEISVLVKIVE